MISDITQNIRDLCQKMQKKNTQKHVETQNLNNDKE